MILKQRIIEQIREHGPMPFEEFQAISLYDPEGFFGGETLRSQKSGDFLTSPEVSPLFGEYLAKFVDLEFERVRGRDGNGPPPVGEGTAAEGGGRGVEGPAHTLIEVAAGSGSLLKPLLAHLTTPVDPWAVEASPAARALLEGIIPGKVVSSLDDIPGPFTGVIIANELLDNIPVSIVIRTGDGWRERWVGLDGEELALVDAPARPEVAEWAARFGLPCPEGGIVEVQIAAGEWVKDALARLTSGTLLLIDYGDMTENLAPRRQDGTLRTYKSHHLGPHPLHAPGETDVTVDVNFTAMQAAAESAGAEVEVIRQAELLERLGMRELISALRHDALDAARAGDALRQMQLKSVKTEADTLMHPRGLGDFRALVARV